MLDILLHKALLENMLFKGSSSFLITSCLSLLFSCRASLSLSLFYSSYGGLTAGCDESRIGSLEAMKENYCFNAVQDGVSYKIAFPKVTFYKGLNCPAAHKDSTETLSTDCQSTASDGSYGYGAAMTVTENEEREGEEDRRFLQTSGDDDNPPPRGNTDLYNKWYEYIAIPQTASPASSSTVAPSFSPSEAPITTDPSFSPSDAPLSYSMEPTTPGPTAPTLEPTIFPSATLSPSEVPVAFFPTLLPTQVPVVSSEAPSPYPSPSTPITPSTSVKVNFAQVSYICIFLRF
jgi:hypothetical protein